MRTDDLDFELPEGLIATRAADPRDSSRLLVVSRSDPSRMEDRVFSELPGLLESGDVLVFNRSRVVRARVRGRMKESGGKVEGLFLRAMDDGRWVMLLKTKRARAGKVVELFEGAGDGVSGVELELLERCDAEGGGAWVVEVYGGDGMDPEGVLARVGLMPLPPYILKQREVRGEGVEDEGDGERYQTVFAHGEAGSVAAPTAGLHFTDRVFRELEERGVERDEVELHVGIGTFRPIESETLEEHVMHTERCTMGSAGARFAGGKPTGGRVIGVGSTSVRTLESYARVVEMGGSVGDPIDTDIMIAPGYGWRWVDGMVTNFHLPRSTLIAMVAAMLETEGVDGVERVRGVYAHAIRERYRFYSFGDAMLILP